MGVNKVEANGEILIDLMNDTVTPETLAEGVTAHDASGEKIVGTMSLNKITDLKGRTFKVKSGWQAASQLGVFSVDYDITYGATETTLNRTKLGLGYSVEQKTIAYALIGAANIITVFNGSSTVVSEYATLSRLEAFTITFNGGTDTTNTALINWLYQYGELQELTVDLSAYQLKEDENLDTQSKEVVGAINEVNKHTIDKVKGFFLDGKRSNTFLYPDGTICWMSRFTTFDDIINPETWDQKVGKVISEGYTSHEIPLVAGENVTFEVDEANQVVKINATGGGSANSLEMPQIRFTSATGGTDGETSNLYVDDEYPLKLTVEIVGGGALKVGDQLQVCQRKRFNGSASNGFKRKYKLQRFAEYVVTEEDLDKQYLTVSVRCEYQSSDISLKHAYRGLFHDGMAGAIAPLYLRIRRAKGIMQHNDSGQTVDAEFSNIVTIWKHSIRGMQTIRIQ